TEAGTPAIWEWLSRFFRKKTQRPGVESWLREGAQLAADAFVQLAIVKGRREGKLPVLGGIRIVREATPNASPAQPGTA
ncbi:MAG: hypothetical protein JNL62_08635, partial [Bryobacterales bacterium]|nr:hypothetical protein [Bryobacterales bacterium]